MMNKLICKCCGSQARWCGDKGLQEGQDSHECDEIHCDYCGMHYSCEHPSTYACETIEECKSIMLRIYNHEKHN